MYGGGGSGMEAILILGYDADLKIGAAKDILRCAIVIMIIYSF